MKKQPSKPVIDRSPPSTLQFPFGHPALIFPPAVLPFLLNQQVAIFSFEARGWLAARIIEVDPTERTAKVFVHSTKSILAVDYPEMLLVRGRLLEKPDHDPMEMAIWHNCDFEGDQLKISGHLQPNNLIPFGFCSDFSFRFKFYLSYPDLLRCTGVCRLWKKNIKALYPSNQRSLARQLEMEKIEERQISFLLQEIQTQSKIVIATLRLCQGSRKIISDQAKTRYSKLADYRQKIIQSFEVEIKMIRAKILRMRQKYQLNYIKHLRSQLPSQPLNIPGFPLFHQGRDLFVKGSILPQSGTLQSKFRSLHSVYHEPIRPPSSFWKTFDDLNQALEECQPYDRIFIEGYHLIEDPVSTFAISHRSVCLIGLGEHGTTVLHQSFKEDGAVPRNVDRLLSIHCSCIQFSNLIMINPDASSELNCFYSAVWFENCSFFGVQFYWKQALIFLNQCQIFTQNPAPIGVSLSGTFLLKNSILTTDVIRIQKEIHGLTLEQIFFPFEVQDAQSASEPNFFFHLKENKIFQDRPQPLIHFKSSKTTREDMLKLILTEGNLFFNLQGQEIDGPSEQTILTNT